MCYTKILLCLMCWMGTFDCSKSYNFGWELRFNGGNSKVEGKLEILYDDQWGYVCADGFGQVEADVVCKNTEGRFGVRIGNHRVPALEFYPVSNFSLETTPIILEGVKCNGSEDRIFECQHNGLFNASCPGSAIVGLKCGRLQSDYIRDDQKGLFEKTYIGLYDPRGDRSFTNIMAAGLTYWWGYFCDNWKGHRQGEIHCNGIGLDAYRRFLFENNVLYYVSGKAPCRGKEASKIQCGTYHECKDVKNDSVICITDESDLSGPPSGTIVFSDDGRRRGITSGSSQFYKVDKGARLRLVGGKSLLDGRLEVSWGGGIWGSVCARFWGLGSARFACRHLGFTGVEEYGTVKGNASYPMLQYLSCNDEHETYWYDCLHRYTRPEKVACSSFASVKCLDFANEGTLRLTGTAVAGEGRLEIFHDGVWGTVRNKKFPNVACKQLGYPGTNFSRAKIEFEMSTFGPVLLDIIDCEGSEAFLLDCIHRWYNYSKIHPDPTDMRCYRPGNFTPRLYNGTSVYEGRLELWEGNQWRRVCRSTIGIAEAEVICRQLGHESLETLYNWPMFGNGINPVLSWSFNCNHVVKFLNQCDYSYVTSRKLDCESIAVKCLKKERITTTGWVLRGVAIVLLGFAIVSPGVVLFTLKRKRMHSDEPTEENHGQQMPPDYNSLPTTSPGVDPSDEAPPPLYETLSL